MKQQMYIHNLKDIKDIIKATKKLSPDHKSLLITKFLKK